MEIARLALERFRNLAPLALEPHPRFNILEGRNGQGKTNLLEAIYLLATLRSFRESRTRSLLAWGAQDAWVRGEVSRRGLVRKLGVEIAPKGKRAAVDGRVVTRLSDYFGHLHVVLFGPEDLALTKGGPKLRRDFLDRAVFNVRPGYLDEARAYVTALRHRNELLRTAAGRRLDPAVLASFDEELVRRGARILWRRLGFLAELWPVFTGVFASITEGAHEVEMSYSGVAGLGDGLAVPDEATVADRFRERLEEAREPDLRRGYTGHGPHMDDVILRLDGHQARHHASQGQHRAFALALKISELQLAEATLGSCPVLLLDDVSSELDRRRNAQLMSFLDGSGGQVFITTTDRSWIQVAGASRVFEVAGGRVVAADGSGDRPG